MFSDWRFFITNLLPSQIPVYRVSLLAGVLVILRLWPRPGFQIMIMDLPLITMAAFAFDQAACSDSIL